MFGTETFINLLSTHYALAVFLGAFFFGEVIILSAAFFAVQQPQLLPTLFFMAYLGTVISDTLWFALGKYVLKETKFWKKQEEKRKKYLKLLDRVIDDKSFFTFLFLKFIYGTRIATILYLSLRRLHVKYFLLYNNVSVFIWLVIIVAIGWYGAKGFQSLYPTLQRFEYAAGALVVLVVFVKLALLWFRRIAARSKLNRP